VVAVTGQAAATAQEEGTRLEKAWEVLLNSPADQLGPAIIAFKETLAKTQMPGIFFFSRSPR
jgi:hypothetical protein